MSLSMPDSVTVADLPPGYPAYLGYTDGAVFPATCAALAARFPTARRVCLTTNGSTLLEADGCDVEHGDLDPVEAAAWVRLKLAASPGVRPVVYASVSVMPDVIGQLGARGIPRGRVRLLSAHYRWAGTSIDGNYGEHICGPATCNWPGVPPMDGTQWTDSFRLPNGRVVDMSLLVDGFFGESWTEKIMQELPTVRQGDTGKDVRTVQGLIVARAPSSGFGNLAIDGVFGPKTEAAVHAVQLIGQVPTDGVVGRLTWPVLLGLTP